MNLSTTKGAIFSQLLFNFMDFNTVETGKYDLSSNTASLNGGEVTISIIPSKRKLHARSKHISSNVKTDSTEDNLKDVFQSISPLWHSLATDSNEINNYVHFPLTVAGASFPSTLCKFFENSIKESQVETASGVKLTELRQNDERISHARGSERRFFCDVCGAGLKRKDHLTRHKQSHNPDRPHACTVCTKAFKRKEQLALHYVIHSGEKRHICEECGKGFYRKDHLRKHTRSHITRRVKAVTSNFLQVEEERK